MSKDIKSMYVHVPFCENICSYCDFKRFGYNSVLVKKWLISLKEEQEIALNYFCGEEITSLVALCQLPSHMFRCCDW